MEVRRINWFLPVFLISYVVLSAAAGILIGVLTAMGIALPLWILYVVGEAVTIVIALVYILVSRISIRKDMQYKLIGIKDVIMSVLTGYLFIPLVLFLNNITMLFSNNYVKDSAQGLSAFPYPVQIILIAVIPPLVEEFVFRGLFYGAYRKHGVLKAAVMSGIIFGIFHLNINQFAYAFAIGIIFAYMVEATGSIWSSVCAHFAINTFSITVIQILKLCGAYELASQTETSQIAVDSVGTRLAGIVMMFVLAVVFTALAVLCIRNMAKRHGRLDILKNSFKRTSDNAYEETADKEALDEVVSDSRKVSSTDNEHIATIPAVVTIIASIAYMIIMELMN